MQIFALLRIVQVPPCASVQREKFMALLDQG